MFRCNVARQTMTSWGNHDGNATDCNIMIAWMRKNEDARQAARSIDHSIFLYRTFQIVARNI